MAVEDNFRVPPGDPARVIAAGRALGVIAGEVSDAGKRIAAERAGMAAVWSGDAGSAAVRETSKAGEITSDYGRRVGEGGAALTEYGKTLDDAITGVNGIRAQARQAVADAVQQANRSGPMSADHWQAVVDGAVGPTLRGLGIQYHYVADGLRAAADKAAGALTGLVPFYLPGMSPELLTEMARAGVASGLPMLQRADGVRVGNALADRVKPYLDQGKRIPDDLLAEIERNRLNPWFAKTFLEKLGPRVPMWVVTVSKYQGFPAAYNERVITMFGQLLALGTRSSGPARLSDKYVDDVLAPLDEHNGAGAESAWFLSHYLALGGTFGRDFLNKFGDKLDGLEHDGEKNGYSLARGMGHQWLTLTEVPNDPFESYFHALSFNPDAAQDFFLNPDRLHYYVRDRALDDYLGDRGKSLGEALEAATTVYRNADQTGLRSAQITADFLGTMGELSHKWLGEHWRQGMVPSMGKILNSYADDIYYSLAHQDQPVVFTQDRNLPPGVQLGNKELGTGIYGIGLDPDLVRQVLGQVDHDLATYATVINSQIAAASRYLDANLAIIHADPGEKDDTMVWFGSGYGRVLQTLFGTHMQVQVDIAHDENADWDETKAYGILGVVTGVNVGTTVFPFAMDTLLKKTIFGTATGLFLPWGVYFASRPSNTDAATAKAVDDLKLWWMRNQYEQIDRIQNAGVFAGTPADANTWMKAHGIPPEGKFTDADGKVIPMAAMTKDQGEAYLQWHVDEAGDGVVSKAALLTDAIESQFQIIPPRIK
jgi:hypothetical protein